MSDNDLSIFRVAKPDPQSQQRGSDGAVAPRALAQCSTHEARALLPFDQAIMLRVLPLGLITHHGREVLSAAVDADRLSELRTSLRFATGREVKLVPLPEKVVLEGIFHAYRGDDRRLSESLASVQAQDIPAVKSDVHKLDLPPTSGEAAKFLEALIDYALSRNASDIHIIPRIDGTAIRIRVKGELLSSSSLFGALYHAQIVNRIKILASLDTSKHQLPQDGSFSVTLPHGLCRLRISTMPTLHGEKVVLRCIGVEGIHTLDDLHFPDQLQHMLEDFLKLKEGALLLAGPTGSGKTTSMYAVVHELASRNLNVVSVEDPIEFPLPGISQSAVDEKVGLTYAASLRAVLRQDPDVILIGEIRDQESAAIALQAALTGHLIVSTVHARSVFDVFLRLQHLGLDALSISQGIEMILCQRLIPRLCEQCKVIDLSRSNMRGFNIYRKVGCASCDYSGYSSKLLICEALSLTVEIREALSTQTMNKEILRSLCSEQNYYAAAESLSQAEKSGIIEEQI